MKELTGIELSYLIKEFKVLEGGRIRKISANSDNVVLQVFVSSKGKFNLWIKPKFVFLSSKAISSEVDKTVQVLRKYIDNAKVVSIEQPELERILIINLSSNENYKLVIELFSKGNILLLKEDNTILFAQNEQIWKDREIIKGKVYVQPSPKKAINNLSFDEFVSITKGKKLVNALAKDVGIGGKFAEEVLANITIKNEGIINTSNLSNSELKSIFDFAKSLVTKDISPFFVSEKGTIVDADAFKMKIHDIFELKPASSFSEAVEEAMGKVIFVSKYTKDLERLERIREQQLVDFKDRDAEISLNKEIGDYIYEKYSVIKELLDNIWDAKKVHSWKEIEEALSKKKQVKSVDLKNKEIVLEL